MTKVMGVIRGAALPNTKQRAPGFKSTSFAQTLSTPLVSCRDIVGVRHDDRHVRVFSQDVLCGGSQGQLDLGFGASQFALEPAVRRQRSTSANETRDRLGRRKMVLVAAMIFAAGAVGMALSPTVGGLIFFRIVAGLREG